MKSYALELPGGDPTAGERARAAAEQLTREGTAVRMVRSVYAPEYETCRLIFEAVAPDVVELAGARAGLKYERIVEEGRPT